MLLIAVIPALAYALFILLSAWLLIRRWKMIADAKTTVLSKIYIGALAQVLSSFVPLALTEHYSISTVACLTGMWGIYINMTLILLSLALFSYTCFAGNHGFWAEVKNRKSFIWAVLASQVLASIIYLRSAILCTV